MHYDYNIRHVPGKELTAANFLSRKPTGKADEQDQARSDELSQATIAAVRLIPATTERLSKIRQTQRESAVGCRLLDFIRNGWPAKMPEEISEYSKYQGSLHECKGIVLMSHRVWILDSLWAEMLHLAHKSHMRREKTTKLALTSLWWPSIHTEIVKLVESCQLCAQQRPNKAEKVTPAPPPKAAWVKVGVVILKHKGEWYLIVVYYFSKFIELARLMKLDSKTTIP